MQLFSFKQVAEHFGLPTPLTKFGMQYLFFFHLTIRLE